MKFCPNCGYPLDGKLKCNCGYDVKTGEVDEKIYDKYKEKETSLYQQSCDNFIGMMGKNPNISSEEVLNQMNQPIFNKENDNIYGEELSNLILSNQKDKENNKK